jgi:WD40 repeat protein
MAVALGPSVYIWRAGHTAELTTIDRSVDAVCWVGDHLAFSASGHIELWDVTRQQAVQHCVDHSGRAAAIGAYRRRFATGGADGMIRVYDQRGEVSNEFRGHRREVSALAWSRDGVNLASGGLDKCVNIWGGRKKLKLELESAVSGLAWMPSGVLLTGDRSHVGTVGLFHSRTEDDNRMVETAAPVSGICWSEQWGIIVAHEDPNGIWELWSNDLAKRLADYQGHSLGITNIACNPAGDLVATISQDHTVKVWELNLPSTAHSHSPSVRKMSPSPGRGAQAASFGRTTPIASLR